MTKTIVTLVVMMTAGFVFAMGNLLEAQQGQWTVDLHYSPKIHPGPILKYFVRSLFKGGEIDLKILCEGEEEVNFLIKWTLRRSSCVNEYIGLSEELATHYSTFPEMVFGKESIEYLSDSFSIHCNRHAILYPEPYIYSQVNRVNSSDGDAQSTDKDTLNIISGAAANSVQNPVQEEGVSNGDSKSDGSGSDHWGGSEGGHGGDTDSSDRSDGGAGFVGSGNAVGGGGDSTGGRDVGGDGGSSSNVIGSLDGGDGGRGNGGSSSGGDRGGSDGESSGSSSSDEDNGGVSDDSRRAGTPAYSYRETSDDDKNRTLEVKEKFI